MLELYDRDRHHVGLSSAEGDVALYGFLVAGAYNKGFRRQMQSEFDGVHFGDGDALVNLPGLSSWTQRDFSGGAFQYTWDRDNAMFAACHNFLPSQFARSVRTVPPLVNWVGATSFLSTSETPMVVFTYGGYLHAVFEDSFQRWDLATGTNSSVTPGVPASTHRACFMRDRGHVLHAFDDAISAFDLDAWSGWSWTVPPPDDAVGDVTGMSADSDRLVVAYDDVLWVAQLPDTRTSPPNYTPDNGDFTRIGRLPGRWTASCWYSGLLYILCSGSDTRTQLVAFDGTSVLPITDFPYNFVGESIEVYGGRVYVGGSGRDIQTATPRYAELYEITGASLRLIRTFAPQRWGAGGTQPTSIPSMTVHEGLLFFGVKGVGLAVYDLTTDSFYGGPEFQAADATGMATRLVSGREDLFAWCGTLTNYPGESGWYRPATAQETISSYDSELETSDFAMAFDRTKRWRELRALTRNTTYGMGVDYSVDGGDTWAALPAATVDEAGTFLVYTYDLSGVAESRTIRYRFKIINSTDVSSFREFVGFTTTFRVLGSDSVAFGEHEKRAWVFTVGGMDRMEGGDGSDVVQDLEAMRDQLWTWARSREQLKFKDLDGSIVTVEIDTLDEAQPDVLPPVEFREPGAVAPTSISREAYFKLTLVEV